MVKIVEILPAGRRRISGSEADHNSPGLTVNRIAVSLRRPERTAAMAKAGATVLLVD